jgi:hypothetical protein
MVKKQKNLLSLWVGKVVRLLNYDECWWKVMNNVGVKSLFSMCTYSQNKKPNWVTSNCCLSRPRNQPFSFFPLTVSEEIHTKKIWSFDRLPTRDYWFWQNFIVSMCDIKFWKGNENLRSVYKKTVFRNVERFLPFLTFSVLKKVHCPF